MNSTQMELLAASMPHLNITSFFPQNELLGTLQITLWASFTICTTIYILNIFQPILVAVC
jgi:hypothetical protein